MTYRILLFFHITGVVLLFVGVGAWFFAALTVRRANRTEEVRNLGSMYEMGATLGLTGILVLAASGFDMALTVWSFGLGWIQVATAAFVLMSPVGPLVIGPRIERLIREARRLDDGPLPAALIARVNDPVPKFGVLMIVGDLAGIVFIMTVKPSFVGSIAAIVGFVVLAALLGLPPVGRAVSNVVDVLAKLERSNPLYRR